MSEVKFSLAAFESIGVNETPMSSLVSSRKKPTLAERDDWVTMSIVVKRSTRDWAAKAARDDERTVSQFMRRIIDRARVELDNQSQAAA